MNLRNENSHKNTFSFTMLSISLIVIISRKLKTSQREIGEGSVCPGQIKAGSVQEK